MYTPRMPLPPLWTQPQGPCPAPPQAHFGSTDAGGQTLLPPLPALPQSPRAQTGHQSFHLSSAPPHTLLGLRPQAGVLLDLSLGPIPPRPLTLTHCLAPSFCLDDTVPLLPIPHICGPDPDQRPQLPAQPAASGTPHTTSVTHAVPSAVSQTLGPPPPHCSFSSDH